MQLKDFNGDYAYTLYELQPFGYAILLNSTNGLLEACYSKGAYIPFDMSKNAQYYYGGPGTYCMLEEKSFVNLYDGSLLSSDVLRQLSDLQNIVQDYEIKKAASQLHDVKDNSQEKAAATSTISSYVYQSYFSSLVDYGLNLNGTCTVIAAQMLLGYYDYYINDYFVDTIYEQGMGTSESFHQHLNDYVYGNSAQQGIYIRDAAPGINRYLEDQGLEVVLKSEHSTQANAISRVISSIRSGIPVIASMARSYDGIYDHSVLVYGVTYDTNDPTSTAVFVMNMGWRNGTSDGQSNTRYVASAGWFYECGYLESTCETHSMSLWSQVDHIYHQSNCRFCNYSVTGMHMDHWNSRTNRCDLCGRTGIIGGV